MVDHMKKHKNISVCYVNQFVRGHDYTFHPHTSLDWACQKSNFTPHCRHKSVGYALESNG